MNCRQTMKSHDLNKYFPPLIQSHLIHAAVVLFRFFGGVCPRVPVSPCPRANVPECSVITDSWCDCRPRVFTGSLLPTPPPFSLLHFYTDSSPLPGFLIFTVTRTHTLHHSYLVPQHCANRRGQTLIYITKVS